MAIVGVLILGWKQLSLDVLSEDGERFVAVEINVCDLPQYITTFKACTFHEKVSRSAICTLLVQRSVVGHEPLCAALTFLEI